MGGYCWEAFHKVDHLGQTPDVSQGVQVCLSESLHMYCKLLPLQNQCIHFC